MAIGGLFPGQASQYVGMARDLYEKYEKVRAYFDHACEILEFDLKKVCFEGPEEELKQTSITQPAIFVHSCAAFDLLKSAGFRPDFVAGHSLGEYSALVAAEALTFEEGLKLVKLRGQLMQNAGKINPGTMAAIIGLSPEKVEEVCEVASEQGVVVPANFNSPEQIAISGSIEGVQAAIKLAKEAGAKRAIELVVSGAFHSPLMAEATGDMREALMKAEIHPPVCRFIPNVTAEVTGDPEKIRELLIRQLTSPVRWVETIETMIKGGVSQFYEIGPGKVLTGLVRRIDRTVPCSPVGTVEEIVNFQ